MGLRNIVSRLELKPNGNNIISYPMISLAYLRDLKVQRFLFFKKKKKKGLSFAFV